MNERIYALLLDDPGKPGYCSFSKPYFGSEEVITTAAGLLRDRDGFEDTVRAIDAYFAGNQNATHVVAYQTEPILKRFKQLSEYTLFLSTTEWVHMNIWNCAYIMKCDKALVHQIIIKYEKKYCRCLRVWFDNLCYKTPGGEWENVTHWWGHRYLMLNYNLPDNNFKLNNVLYLLDKSYDTLEEALDSLTKPGELSFASFCDEIFADG